MSKPNEMAFPVAVESMENSYISPGLTKREYFATAAMQAIARDWSDDVTNWRIEKMAQTAVEYADALIAALERKPE